MKPILLLLILIAVPVAGWAEAWKPNTTAGWCCREDSVIIPCVTCVEPVKKSKRQYYIEKCDEYLKFAEQSKIHEGSNNKALLAQAYCLRASLEEK